MYKYEKVIDLNLNEIAIAMINGELFYSEDGSTSFHWSGKEFINSDGNPTFVFGDFYRRIKPKWYEKLDGTQENGVLCWVGEEKFPEIITGTLQQEGNFYFTCHEGSSYLFATPLTKSEIQHLLDNAPE